MNVISGKNVDLIFPFPMSEVRRTYGWNHCYRTLTETDDSPNTPEVFVPWMESVIASVPTWGIIDKNHITNIKHEAPLVGIGIFEPIVSPNSAVVRNGLLHVATARKAWRTGLVDEAGFLGIKTLFEEIPTLLRISAIMVEKNFPAKALAKRLGFKFEGLIEDGICKDGNPENTVMFGLTRRKYTLWAQQWEDPSGVQSVECSGASSEALAKMDPQVDLKVPVEPAADLPLVRVEEPLQASKPDQE
jgi:RimJ/RimL family protein N-acetyltransferase